MNITKPKSLSAARPKAATKPAQAVSPVPAKLDAAGDGARAAVPLEPPAVVIPSPQRGKPRMGTLRRIHIAATVDPATATALDAHTTAKSQSLGKSIDQVVRHAQATKFLPPSP